MSEATEIFNDNLTYASP